MRVLDVDSDVVWMVIGLLALGGAIYLTAIDKISGEVVATILGVIAKGFVDALGRRHDNDVEPKP